MSNRWTGKVPPRAVGVPAAQPVRVFEHFDETGDIWYYNPETKETFWMVPEGAILVPLTAEEEAIKRSIFRNLAKEKKKKAEAAAREAAAEVEMKRVATELARKREEERLAKEAAAEAEMKRVARELAKKREQEELEKEINYRLYGQEAKRKADEEKEKQRRAEEARKAEEARDSKQAAVDDVYASELIPEAKEVLGMSPDQIRAKFPTASKAKLFLMKLHPSNAAGNKPLENALTSLFQDLNAQIGHAFGKASLIGLGKKRVPFQGPPAEVIMPTGKGTMRGSGEWKSLAESLHEFLSEDQIKALKEKIANIKTSDPDQRFEQKKQAILAALPKSAKDLKKEIQAVTNKMEVDAIVRRLHPTLGGSKCRKCGLRK